jgi:hypothetical protein
MKSAGTFSVQQGAVGKSAGPKPLVAPSTMETGARRPSNSAPEEPFHETRFGWVTLGVVWLASAAYLAFYLRQGWIPHDAGMLAESAQRVLRGQAPYRDFVEVYTGGLTYLNALAFRMFGANFMSPRIFLFLFFLGWVPSVYFIARRFAGPLVAAAVTLLSVAWSVPNYPEAMPSWYNLFFSIWGALALIRYIETEKSRWIWIAGICSGLSFLFKISGLYFVAAGLLFFVYREQLTSHERDDAGLKPGAAPIRGGLPYQLFVTCGLGLFVLALADLISQRPTAGDYFQFLLPSAAIAAFLLWEEWRHPGTGNRRRFRRLFSTGAPFLAGTALPVIPFLLWYAHEGALRDWFEGTFVQGSLHTQWAGYDALSLAALLVLAPVLVVIIAAYDSHPSIRRLARSGSPLLLGALLVAAWKWFGFYVFLGCSPVFFVVLAALAAPPCLRRAKGIGGWKRQEVFLIVTATAAFALIQFPFSMILYFCYVAPFVALALLALWSIERSGEKAALAAVVGFYFIFALVLHAPGYFIAAGGSPHQKLDLRPIALAGAGGIRAPAKLATEYENLVRLIRAHAHGRYIYCAADCPEVYFLSGFRNPTGSIYDFLDPHYPYPTVRDQRILNALADRGVSVVVLAPADRTDSGVVPPALKAELDARYPESAMAGRFEVRWKP